MGWRERARRAAGLSRQLRLRVTDLYQRLYWDLRDLLPRLRAAADSNAVEVRVLFVCLGNICRSPLAEGIFGQQLARIGLADRVGVDSAGTSGWNIGKRPHWKARACAARHGIAIGHRRARMFMPADFDRFDRILVMDRRNRQDVLSLAPHGRAAGRVRLLLDFAGGGDIPDPIDGTAADFESVFHQIEAACDGLVADVARELNHRGATATVARR